MKRGLIIVCACLLIVSSLFSGCGTSDTQGTTEEVTQATEEQTTEATSEEVTETQEETTEKAEEASASEESPVTYEYTQVDDSYFNDAVFIGDSISYGFELYVTEKHANGETVLGEAQFLTSGSLSYGNSLWDVSDESVHPTYNGEKMKLEDAIAQIKPGKIFILLGTNDVALYGVEQTIANADTEISRMLEASPGAEIFIMSTTPKYSPAESDVDGALNNADIDALNVAMRQFAVEKGYNFMNIAPLFKDETGGLAADYCSDKEGMGIHFTSAAYDIWLDFLYSYGKQQ
ncbi:MAG: GDSL-type esterase/lipase family protein [Anaeromassilibacillus sp.]|nr:GDSL-type esterase/lipase family protein [Anaeromassilibacillus sp.]MDY3780240.1 GDSL-type esterase/lipase family protein [Candidatus Limousia pullorum]